MNNSLPENTTSQQDSVVEVSYSAAQCYYRPETEELVFMAGDEAGPFETHWRGMMNSMDEFHQAKADYSSKLEQYARAAVAPLLPDATLEKHVVAIDQAESKMEETRAALKKKLGDLSNRGASYEEVVELIPVGRGKKTKGAGKAARYAYVKKGYFSKTEQGRKLHTVSLKSGDKDGATKSVFSKDKNGNIRVDTRKLQKQLTQLQSPKMKLDLAKALKLMGSDFDVSELSQDFTLFDWAESWNNSLLYKKEVNANVDVSAGAQFMRFVSNVAMNADFDPNKNRGTFKGEAKASIALASGFSNVTLYAPDRLGWALSVQENDGKSFDLGMLRVSVEGQLSGFLGASAQLEAQLQVMFEGDQQLIAGQSGGRLPRFRERRATGRQFHQAMEVSDEGLQASGAVFAGARLEGGLKGSVQWLKPTPAPDESGKALPALLQSSGQFTSFCTFGSSIAGLLGAGGGGKLRCTFINGKFCFQIAASLCWGAGAKGAFLAEVDVATFAEFGAWLIYQLYSLDYAFFDVIDRKAFEVYSQYCVMQMANMEKSLYELFEGLAEEGEDVAKGFKAFIDEFLDKKERGMASSKKRNMLAKNICEYRSDLLMHTPEAKGILLYLLTRHGSFDHLDPDNRTLSGDIYAERKEAIICILTSIQTFKEWGEVLCRMTTDGSRLPDGGNRVVLTFEQEQHLISFLQEGYNRDNEFHRAKWDIQVIRTRLKVTPTQGYALTMNDSVFHSLHQQRNTYFAQRCELGPCETKVV